MDFIQIRASRIALPSLYSPTELEGGVTRYTCSFPVEECPRKLTIRMPAAMRHIERVAQQHADKPWAGTIRAQSTIAPTILEEGGRESVLRDALDYALSDHNIPYMNALTGIPADLIIYTYKIQKGEDEIGLGLRAVRLNYTNVRNRIDQLIREAHDLFKA